MKKRYYHGSIFGWKKNIPKVYALLDDSLGDILIKEHEVIDLISNLPVNKAIVYCKNHRMLKLTIHTISSPLCMQRSIDFECMQGYRNVLFLDLCYFWYNMLMMLPKIWCLSVDDLLLNAQLIQHASINQNEIEFTWITTSVFWIHVNGHNMVVEV